MTTAVVLPTDVELVPVSELPDETRSRIDWSDGDYALTRPLSRAPTKVLDADAAALLARFRTPATVVEAVIAHSRDRGLDPTTTLESAYPMLQNLVRAGLLVPADSDRAEPIAPTNDDGGLDGFDVVACVQVVDDTEVYQVRLPTGGFGALKIGRPGAGPLLPHAFAREAALLRGLGGVAPRVLEARSDAARPWVLMEWCPGVDAATAAAEAAGDPGVVAALAAAMLDAYADLHARHVLHSDIHPRNVLVDADGGIRLVDFGYARLDQAGDPLSDAPRAGVPFFFEPEYARAVRAGTPPPPSSPAGEQYALAALVQFLMTGHHYLEFSLESDELLRQVAEDPPLPFAERGVPAWPEVEAVLARALAKDPGERYPSVAAFAHEFRRAAECAPPAAPRPDAPVPDRLVPDWLSRLDPEAGLFTGGLPAPTASVQFGAAGIAHALHRIAAVQGSPRVLALAHVWGAQALLRAGDDDAFLNPALELDADTVGPVTPYHRVSGVHAVRALLAHASGDPAGWADAASAFARESGHPTDHLDLTLGRSGTAAVAALLLEPLGADARSASEPLLSAGRDAVAAVWSRLAAEPPIGEASALPNLGMAHGWAGFAYAALRWTEASGDAPPDALGERLDQLARLAEPFGRGLRWPWQRVEGGQRPQYMPGWCNGSAGYVSLWLAAHRVWGDDTYLGLAERAAWHAWEDPAPAANLCCGLVGRAYALLALGRQMGTPAWVRRARRLADRAGQGGWPPDAPPHSLFKGELGLAVLQADLEAPDAAAMPFFEREGWPPR